MEIHLISMLFAELDCPWHCLLYNKCPLKAAKSFIFRGIRRIKSEEKNVNINKSQKTTKQTQNLINNANDNRAYGRNFTGEWLLN